jgi:transposase
VGPQVLFPPGAGLVLEQIQLYAATVHLFVHRDAAGAYCPSCACWSSAFNSSYDRRIAALPVPDHQVAIHLQVRRFGCQEQTCPRRTFVEQVPLICAALRLTHPPITRRSGSCWAADLAVD